VSPDWTDPVDHPSSKRVVDWTCLNDGYHIENGRSDIPLPPVDQLALINQSLDHTYYIETFFNRDHVTFIATDEILGPVVFTVEKAKKDSKLCKALLRTSEGDSRFLLKCNSKNSAMRELALCKPQVANLKFTRNNSSELEQKLIRFEKQQIVTNYKFGVLYCKAGQTDENQMYFNDSTSPAFEEFLSFLGERVELKGWNFFRGGLDVKDGSTGDFSVYTKHQNFEIMFHVSSLLPHNPNDPQSLEKKRHLGNDIVVLVFMDSVEDTFNPCCIHSNFNHVFVVVRVEPDRGPGVHYKLSIVQKPGIAVYKPYLPFPSVMAQNAYTRQFLLTKLINAERAAMSAPTFKEKTERTRRMLLTQIFSSLRVKSGSAIKGKNRVSKRT